MVDPDFVQNCIPNLKISITLHLHFLTIGPQKLLKKMPNVKKDQLKRNFKIRQNKGGKVDLFFKKGG